MKQFSALNHPCTRGNSVPLSPASSRTILETNGDVSIDCKNGPPSKEIPPDAPKHHGAGTTQVQLAHKLPIGMYDQQNGLPSKSCALRKKHRPHENTITRLHIVYIHKQPNTSDCPSNNARSAMPSPAIQARNDTHNGPIVETHETQNQIHARAAIQDSTTCLLRWTAGGGHI